MMESPFRLENPVRADALCDANQGRDQNHRDTRPFDLLGERSPATRAGASSGGENSGLYPLSLHVQGNFFAYPRHRLDIGHVPGGHVIVVV